jgi:hypothetical protein
MKKPGIRQEDEFKMFKNYSKIISTKEVAEVVNECLRDTMSINAIYGEMDPEDVVTVDSLEACVRRMIWATYRYADPKRLDFLLQKVGVNNMVNSPEDDLQGVLTANEVLTALDRIKGAA